MAQYGRCRRRLSMLIGAMLLIVPIISFQGSEVKTAEGQSECRAVEVTIFSIIVFDDEDSLTVSDNWYMDLWAYDDNAVTHPTVTGGGFGGSVEYIENFRIDGNYDLFRSNIGPFDVRPPSSGFRVDIPNRVTIDVPEGSALNIFFQGYELDIPGFGIIGPAVKDGVGIVSIRHDRSENLGIGPVQTERSNTGGYQIFYRIRCNDIFDRGQNVQPGFQPDTRFTFLDATFTDNTAQSHVAAAHIALNINGRILHIPSSTPADLGTVPMTSGVPLTFIEDPAVEFQRGDRAQISITFRDDSIRRIPAGFIGDCPGPDDIDPGFGRPPLACIPRLLSITLSNSHGSTDSNFEGVHSISTSTPIRVTDASGTTHEISLTIRYRLDVL
jgi:hypothetical protein